MPEPEALQGSHSVLEDRMGTQTELATHPAVVAWRAIQPRASCPDSIEVLKREVKSTVYRLQGAGPAGSAEIAKRCMPETARLERTIYEQILPRVAVTRLEYYGSLVDEADDVSGWLFLEDAGGTTYSPTDPEHRALAGRWLGLLHSGATQLVATAGLAERGPGYYLERLRIARGTLSRGLGNPLLSADEICDVEAVIAQCDWLESRWRHVEEACADAPVTLVHGDLRCKNVRLRASPTGLVVLPMDWEQAGRAVPAADLTRVDLAAYQSAVQDSWPDLGGAAIQRLAAVGRIFQRLAAIDWISPWLDYDSRLLLAKPVEHIAVHRAALARELEAAGLGKLTSESADA